MREDSTRQAELELFRQTCEQQDVRRRDVLSAQSYAARMQFAEQDRLQERLADQRSGPWEPAGRRHHSGQATVDLGGD